MPNEIELPVLIYIFPDNLPAGTLAPGIAHYAISASQGGGPPTTKEVPFKHKDPTTSFTRIRCLRWRPVGFELREIPRLGIWPGPGNLEFTVGFAKLDQFGITKLDREYAIEVMLTLEY
jgi:hypothetical protein